MAKARPKHLNLFQIRQPIPAVVSIMHRVSGAVLFVFLWVILWALERSLASPEAFAEMRETLDQPLAKMLMLALVWAFLHHTFAGLRHLALDLQIGVELPKVRAMSYAALLLGLGLTIVIAVLVW